LFYFFDLSLLDFDLCSLSYLEAKESMVYSYTRNFNAFAAKLSDDEAKKLSGKDSFSIFSGFFKPYILCY